MIQCLYHTIESIQMRNNVKEEVRRGFKVNVELSQDSTIQACLKEAESNLQTIKFMGSKNGSNEDKSSNTGTWMDNSEEGDERGRVGVGWPWER